MQVRTLTAKGFGYFQTCTTQMAAAHLEKLGMLVSVLVFWPFDSKLEPEQAVTASWHLTLLGCTPAIAKMRHGCQSFTPIVKDMCCQQSSHCQLRYTACCFLYQHTQWVVSNPDAVYFLPAGWGGEACATPQKRPCTHRYRSESNYTAVPMVRQDSCWDISPHALYNVGICGF